MIVTATTRTVLAFRRQKRLLLAAGFEGPFESPIWQIYRGGRVGERIIKVEIATNGLDLYILTDAARPLDAAPG